MKLRIKGNSLRLRVSRSELDRILIGDRVEETIYFGAVEDARLTYALQIGQQREPLQLKYEDMTVTALLSERQAAEWGVPTEIGIYTVVKLNSEKSVEITIEKDFACLDRGEEGNEDTFENPNAGVTC